MIQNENIVEKAVAFAANAYCGKSIENTKIPYIIKVMETVVIMSAIDPKDKDLMAAAALHGITKNTTVTPEELEAEFGARIKSILLSADLSENAAGLEGNFWLAQKQREAEALKKLPLKIKMIHLADKLAEIRELFREYQYYREGLWERLSQPDPKLWSQYYYKLSDAFFEFEEYAASAEFNRLIAQLFVAYR